MQKSNYFQSCEYFFYSFLLPLIQDELSLQSEIHGLKDKVKLEILNSYKYIAYSKFDSNLDSYVIGVSKGVFFKMCYITEIYYGIQNILDNGAVPTNNVALFDLFSLTIHEKYKDSYHELQFQTIDELKVLFYNTYSEDEFISKLHEIEKIGIHRANNLDEENIKFPKESTKKVNTYVMHSFRFLIFHEFSHIIRRHFSIINQLTNKQILNEINDSGIPDEYLYKAMELDADIAALHILMNSPILREMYIRDNYLDYFYFDLMTGVSLLLSSFDITLRSTFHYQGETHPIPDLRYILSSVHFHNKLTQYRSESEQTLFDVSWQVVLIESQKIFSQLFSQGAPYSIVGKEIFVNFHKSINVNYLMVPESILDRVEEDFKKGMMFYSLNFVDNEIFKISKKLIEIQENFNKMQ